MTPRPGTLFNNCFVSIGIATSSPCFQASTHFQEVDKTRNFHGITENSAKYGNVHGIVKKIRNFSYIVTNHGLVTEIVPSLIHGKVKEFRIYLCFLFLIKHGNVGTVMDNYYYGNGRTVTCVTDVASLFIVTMDATCIRYSTVLPWNFLCRITDILQTLMTERCHTTFTDSLNCYRLTEVS